MALESIQRAAPPFFAYCFRLRQGNLVTIPRQVFGVPHGPALLFAVLVTVIYLWIKELFGAATGLFSALAVILTPNLFGFAHIAVTDLPLAAMWFLTAYSFWKGLSNWKWSVVLGIVWGLALATKFPAALIPIPLILWAHIFHRDKYVNNVFALLFLAPVVMIATQPYLWHQTGLRVLEFLYEGISRAYRPDANFPIYFFDQLYTTKQLPWYYSFLIIGITTPEPLLALAFIGLGSIPWSKQRSATLLFLGNTAFVLLMGLLPGAVLHDGVRQMLSALPFLAGLASAGFYVLTTSLLNLARGTMRFQQIANLRAKIIATWFLVLCFSPALDLYLCHPFQLSFYNRLVGGVRGAYERGLETTYFMEAFTPSFLQTLNERIPKNATINASFASFMLDYYQKEGRLRRDLKITNEKPSNYYVLLNRRSTLSPQERNLINGKSEPYVAVTIAGVPLVSVFEFEKGD